jgi:hypothetical protein
MSIDDQAADTGTSRWGWSRVRLPRPTGIRNGGLLLVLVALAAIVALVDEPPELSDGRHLPSIFQTLPPPTGITGLPPAVAQPPAGHAGRRRTAGDGHPRLPEPPASPTGRGLGAVPGRRRDPGRPGPGWVGAGRDRGGWVATAGDDDAGG